MSMSQMVWKLGEEDKIMQRIKVLPQRVLNAYAPGADCPGGYYKDGDFMLHFAGKNALTHPSALLLRGGPQQPF